MTDIPFKVRDLRKKEQFIIDDVYLNGYAKIFGPNGTAVYLSLCRRANKEQYCFPSEKLIAKDHGITDRTVRKYIKLLLKARLIKIERQKNKAGRWYNNVYYLLDKSEWMKPEENNSSGSHRKIKTKPEEKSGMNQRHLIPIKDTQKKDSNNNDTFVKKSFKRTAVNDFDPNNYEEGLCKQIATKLGEEHINYLMSVLREKGKVIIERAWGLYREDEAAGKKISNPPAYFTGIIKNLTNLQGNKPNDQ